ncbi:MAG: glycosyltransferase [Verrucomicrobiales bacterium]
MWAILIFNAMAAMFVGMSITGLINLRWVRRLPSLDELTGADREPGQPIRCSVVIAARDEAERIEQTLRHLLAQRGVAAEFIVVDDRSADGTGDIVTRFAKGDSRLQVKRVDVLPEGWLGKCHACHVGANAAKGDWILFTDADCWLKPDVIARAVRVAEREGADHVTMAAGTVLESTATRAWYLLFLTGLAGWIAGVNRDRPKSHLGIGAFNLVRAAAYRQCGGYEALRLTVVDNIKLGLLLRRAGKRTRAFLGGDDVECHWGKTVGNMVKIMEKNYFAAVDYRLSRVLGFSLALVLVFTLLVLGLFSGTAAGYVAVGSLLAPMLPAAILARRIGWSWPCAVLLPFMFPVFGYTVLNSTFATLRRGGIRWRDTFYPLATLRAGNVQ